MTRAGWIVLVAYVAIMFVVGIVVGHYIVGPALYPI